VRPAHAAHGGYRVRRGRRAEPCGRYEKDVAHRVCGRRKRKIVLEANPGYRDETYPVPGTGSEPGEAAIAQANAGKKLPIIGRVEVSIIEEELPRLLTHDSGALDFL
jgi:hypothetical protein